MRIFRMSGLFRFISGLLFGFGLVDFYKGNDHAACIAFIIAIMAVIINDVWGD